MTMSLTTFGRSITETRPPKARNAFFAAPADDPRARRPADVATLFAAMITVLLLGWHHRTRGDVDQRVLQLFADDIPGWLSGIATVIFVFGGLYSLALVVGVTVFGSGRMAIVRDMLLAGLLGFGAIVVAAYAAGPEFPDLVPELRERRGFPSYPVARLTLAVAVIHVAGPYLALPVRRIGTQLIVMMSVAAVVLSYGTLSATLGGLALGIAAGAAVHVIVGSGLGIPSKARIASALDEIGITADDVEYLERGRAGATLARVRTTDDTALLVKIYGRDSAAAAFTTRLWRSMWYRDAGARAGASTEQLAEHESLMLIACERAGVLSHRLVGWTRSATEDSLVVTKWLEGTRLSELAADEIDDGVLDAVWLGLAELHRARIAHESLEPQRIVVVEGAVGFVHFDSARILRPGRAGRADHAQALVATAIAAGPSRAIEAARRGLGDDGVLAMLAYLQGAALSFGLRRDARAAGIHVGRLRNAAADAIGAAKPETVQLQRVSGKSLAMAALTLLAAYSLITSLTDIGFDTIAEQLSGADLGWIAIAFVIAQLTNVGEYITLRAVIGAPIPFGPTMMFRYALSFVGLAVPGDAGKYALNVRYQQHLGVPAAAAIAQGPLLTLFSKGFELILLALSAKLVGERVDTDQLDVGAVGRLFGALLLVTVIASLVVMMAPNIRSKALPRIREGFNTVKGSVTDPHRLLAIASGTLAQKVLNALALALTVAAFGAQLNFGQAIFVSSAVSLFVGLVPVPGGIGVAETALSGGLIAVGIPQEVAVAAALMHRMITSYIPPLFGFFTSRWLTAHGYL